MNNQHLQSFIAICENDFSATAAAAQTGNAQSSLSKRVHAIEKEIGAPLFARRGRRYLGLTPAGEAALRVAREIMLKQENLRAIGAAYAGDTMRGALRVGATHLQARYLLPQIISSFRRDYPNVSLRIIQGAPSRLARMALDNAVDIAICTEELDAHAPPLRIDFLYSWNRALIAPPAHPLAKKSKITLADLCSYPLVTYERGFTGRAAFDAALRESKLRPAIVVSASDTDIVKNLCAFGSRRRRHLRNRLRSRRRAACASPAVAFVRADAGQNRAPRRQVFDRGRQALHRIVHRARARDRKKRRRAPKKCKIARPRKWRNRQTHRA